MVELPLSLTWTATGNNVMLEADTSRRTLHIRLDSPEENPELRSGFQIPHLVAHVKQQRAALVAAGLTILSAYHAAGRPRMNRPRGGRSMRGPLSSVRPSSGAVCPIPVRRARNWPNAPT